MYKLDVFMGKLERFYKKKNQLFSYSNALIACLQDSFHQCADQYLNNNQSWRACVVLVKAPPL